jgi:membrane protein involved in colicin uptake
MSERHPDDEFEQRAERDRAAAAAKRAADAKAKVDADAKAKADAEAKATTDASAKLSDDEAAARRIATQGAQVVLDPDSDAAIAAKGGMGRTMHENVEARDVALIEMGHDPVSPSAHLTDPKPATAKE